MAKYIMKFWYEWLGSCLWSDNETARDKYGYNISLDSLNISNELKTLLLELGEEHDTSLNWDYPPDPSPWTEEQKTNYLKRSKLAYERLVKELGEDYEIRYYDDVPE